MSQPDAAPAALTGDHGGQCPDALPSRPAARRAATNGHTVYRCRRCDQWHVTIPTAGGRVRAEVARTILAAPDGRVERRVLRELAARLMPDAGTKGGVRSRATFRLARILRDLATAGLITRDEQHVTALDRDRLAALVHRYDQQQARAGRDTTGRPPAP